MAAHPGSFNLRQMIILYLSALGGAIIGLLLIHTIPAEDPRVWLTAVFVIVAGAISLHEFGHMAGALIVGFQIFSVTFGPVEIRRESGRLRLRKSGFNLCGSVTAVPMRSHDLRRRMLVFGAAGPLSSFICGGVAFGLGAILPDSAAAAWATPWGIAFFSIGALSVIPMPGFYRSDGARVWELMRKTAEADRSCALVSISASALAGQRPREWDSVLLEKALATQNGSGDDLLASILAYESAMDRGQFDAAEKYLEAAIQGRSKCPPNVQSGIALDAAFFQSMIQGNATVAREWFNKCQPQHIPDRYALFMVEAAVLLSEGKATEAQSKATQCVIALPGARFGGFAAAAGDWVKVISERAQAQVSNATAENR